MENVKLFIGNVLSMNRIFILCFFISLIPVVSQGQVLTGKGTTGMPEISQLKNDVRTLTQIVGANSSEIQSLTNQLRQIIDVLCPTCDGAEGRADSNGTESEAQASIKLPICATNQFLTSDGTTLYCVNHAAQEPGPTAAGCTPGERKTRIPGVGQRVNCQCNQMGQWQCGDRTGR